MTPPGPPDLLLLLYDDPTEPVTAAVLGHPAAFGIELVAMSAAQLVGEATVGQRWQWRGRTIEPARTAVINRLTMPVAVGPEAVVPPFFAGRQVWTWLERALRDFAYASALPTALSPVGGYGSLLDQWLDLPTLLEGLQVPAHRAPWDRAALHGDVHRVDPWQLYSLGVRVAGGDAPAGGLDYVRPRGGLVHAAQVGGTVMLANVAPGTTAQQQSYIVSFANAMAVRSTTRILEHAFFVGDGVPVFYSTCPVPVITGTLPDYPQLLVQGLRDDLARRRFRTAA